MRLIDADKVDFSRVFGGRSSIMRDCIAAAQSAIDAQPVAFDKGKVIGKLKRLEKSSREFEYRYYDELAAGEAGAYRVAIEIVEKGGIE